MWGVFNHSNEANFSIKAAFTLSDIDHLKKLWGFEEEMQELYIKVFWYFCVGDAK